MGTTRIKVIDLSSDQKEIKTSRKHAEKLTGAAKLKEPARNASQRDAGGEKKPKKGKEGQEGKEGLEDKEGQEKVATGLQIEESSKPSQPSVPSKPSQPSQPSQPSKPSLHHKGHKYLVAKAKIEKDKKYPAKEAIALLSQTSITKFDPTVELHLTVADKNIKGAVALPHPPEVKTKAKRYLVFSDNQSTIDDKQIIWGDEKTIGDVESGQLKPGRDFDAVVASPSFMPKIAKIAKILGPSGMMPNPKNKTVTDDIAGALKTKDEGFTYKTETQAPVIHTKLGKLSEKSERLEENLKVLILAIGPQKIKKATLSSTMGPGIKLDVASFAAK